MTAAAVILLVEGGLGITYAPVLTDSSLGPLQPMVIVIVGVSTLSIVAGIGLLRLYGWARFAAAALVVVSLVFMYVPALVVAVAHGAWPGPESLGIVAYLAVLFAVLRRWPAGPRR